MEGRRNPFVAREGAPFLLLVLVGLGFSVKYLDVIFVIVAVLLLKAAWRIARPALAELTDAGADAKASAEMQRIALAVPGVESSHALRSRRSGPGYFVDLHVLVDPLMSVYDGHEIARAVRAALIEQGPDVIDVLVHVEPWEKG